MRATLPCFLLTLTALAGCGPADGLGNYESKQLFVSASSTRFDGPADRVDIIIGGKVGGPCPLAKVDLQGTVNGVALEVKSLGEVLPYEGCQGPFLSGPAPGPGPLEVRVWDSTGEIRATFATSFEQRTLTLVEPSDGQLYIGDRVVMRYTPASDELLKQDNGELGIWSTRWNTPFTHDGEQISFVVPEVAAYRLGPDWLSLVAVTHALNTSCVGAASCVLTPPTSQLRMPVTLIQAERDAPACYECACSYSDGSTLDTWNESDEEDLVPTRCSLVQCPATDAKRSLQSAACVARTVEEVVLPYSHAPGKATPTPSP